MFPFDDVIISFKNNFMMMSEKLECMNAPPGNIASDSDL